jgi:excisionase family DNA binding protein
MTNQTLIHNVTPEQIVNLFAGLQKQIKELNEKFEPKEPTDLLTRNEVAEMLKCTLPTVYNWAAKGTITSYGINGRVYFKRSEIESALVCLNKKKGANNE